MIHATHTMRPFFLDPDATRHVCLDCEICTCHSGALLEEPCGSIEDDLGEQPPSARPS